MIDPLQLCVFIHNTGLGQQLCDYECESVKEV
jgi:hypothetical protein